MICLVRRRGSRHGSPAHKSPQRFGLRAPVERLRELFNAHSRTSASLHGTTVDDVVHLVRVWGQQRRRVALRVFSTLLVTLTACKLARCASSLHALPTIRKVTSNTRRALRVVRVGNTEGVLSRTTKLQWLQRRLLHDDSNEREACMRARALCCCRRSA